MKERVTDGQELERLAGNLSAMRRQFVGSPLSGEKLYQLLRSKWSDAEYDRELKEKHPVLHQAAAGFRSWNTVYQQTEGGQLPTRELVEDIAAFCTRAFAFDSDVTAEDLLCRDLAPFPPLRRENERWGRYVGLYRCFYLYPDSLEGDELQLHGALLQLREERGKLLCRWVTGIRRDERFGALEELMTGAPWADVPRRLTAFSRTLPPYEGRLVCYEGSMEPSIPGFFLLRLQRVEHPNAAVVALRRWDDSAQPDYSGGVALATLFRDHSKANVACHAMLLTREKMSLAGERALLMRHLNYADNEGKGLCVPVEMDRKWNQAVMEWSYRRAVAAEEGTKA